MAVVSRLRIPFLGALILAGVVACQTVKTTAPGAVGVDRKQHMLVSEAEIEQAAVQSYAQELDKARAKSALNTDPKLVSRVRAITDRLIPQTIVFRPDAKDWKWEVNVQTTDELNAY